MTNKRLLAVLLVVSVLLIAAGQVQPPTPSTSVSRYITALQKADYRKIVDLTLSDQGNIAQIKASNPQAIWDKLIREYYDKRIKALSTKPEFWASYSESLSAMLGDPTQGLRAMLNFLPAGCRWSISETRNKPVKDMWTARTVSHAVVYVKVDYPSIQIAPALKRRFLQESILEFEVEPKTGFIIGMKRVENADVYWTQPYPKEAIPYLAQKYEVELLYSPQQSKPALDDLLSLGWEAAEPVLLDLLRSRSGPTPDIVARLAEHRDPKATPLILNILREGFETSPTNHLCAAQDLQMVKALGAIGKVDTDGLSSYLRAALGQAITLVVKSDRTMRVSRDCVSTYSATLKEVDDPAWENFTFFTADQSVPACSGGVLDGDYANEFSRTVWDLCWHPEQPTYLDATSPNLGHIRTLLARIRPCQSTQYCPSDLTLDWITIAGPNSVKISGLIREFNGKIGLGGAYVSKGGYTVTLGGTGTAQKPWAITDAGERAPTFGVRVGTGVYLVGLASTQESGTSCRFTTQVGTAVTDSNLLASLSRAAWTYDNVIRRPGIRAGSVRVSAILDTSEKLQLYQGIQDALARTAVEGIAALATGGISLAKAPTSLTWAMVRDQLINPKAFLVLSAQIGLDQSLSRYKRLEQTLQSMDMATIDSSELENVRKLYAEAQALEISYGSLAAAMMPKSGEDLLKEALRSIGDQLLPTLPTTSDVLYLQDVLKLQEKLAIAAHSIPAVYQFGERLRLVASVAEAENAAMEGQVQQAVSSCH